MACSYLMVINQVFAHTPQNYVEFVKKMQHSHELQDDSIISDFSNTSISPVDESKFREKTFGPNPKKCNLNLSLVMQYYMGFPSSQTQYLQYKI